MLQAYLSSTKLHTPGSLFTAEEIRLPRDEHRTARLHREWLATLPDITGMQLTTLAKRANVAPSTLTRPAKEGDTGTSTLNAKTIQKLIDYCRTQGLTVPWPAGDVVPLAKPVRPTWGGVPEEGTVFDVRANTALAAAVRAMIGARENVVAVTLLTSALEGLGYHPGDILVYDIDETPHPGDVVRALLYDRAGNVEETVWRRYDPPYLVAFTHNPADLPKPLTEVPGRVTIVGVAVGMIRPSTRNQAA